MTVQVKGGIRPTSISIEQEMATSYFAYSIAVLTDRALPDVRDGMKPVHRRIIYAMDESGYHAGKKYVKSARPVADVMGKYHPHGDVAIYDTMVRMAQPWNQRHKLIDGQGNFGSMDGDSPAAMRYTEARMERLAHEMVADIGKNTVKFVPNYDNSDEEPAVLPAGFPNFLVNGGTGIAVGMASSMPTHNLREVIDATLLRMDNPDCTLEDLMEVLPGPDFPTKGTIMGRGRIKQAYLTGRGSIRISGVADIQEEKGGRSKIVISELPFAVNKKSFVENIAELVNEKKIEGVSDVRDESDREELVRVVIDVRRDTDPAIVLNKIKAMTQFVNNFTYNATCLNSKGMTVTLPLSDILDEFIAFRRQVIRNRTIYDLDKARDALHKQIGLYAAITRIDDVVRAIRASRDVDAARVALMAMDFPTEGEFARLIEEADPDTDVGAIFRLSEIQADAILQLSLSRLTGLEGEKIADKAREISGEIRGHLTILNDVNVLASIVRNEMLQIRDRFGEDRLTRIEASDMEDIDDEDLIELRDVIVTITNRGYIKRTDLRAYREQRRGGKGKSGMATKDDDFVVQTFVCTTKTPLVFFTQKGMSYSIKAYKLPDAPANAKGRPAVNFIEAIASGDTITAVLPLPIDKDEIAHKSIMFVTDIGKFRRSKATDFLNIKSNGKIAMKLDDDDGEPMGAITAVFVADDADDVMIATRSGNVLRTPVADLRVVASRGSLGVKAIKLEGDDRIIAAIALSHFDPPYEERQAYLAGGETVIRGPEGEEGGEGEGGLARVVKLSPERMLEFQNAERWIMSVTANGYAKRTSSHEFRTTGRGGKGVTGATITYETGHMVFCGPVEEDDGLVLATDAGQMIRTRVAEIMQRGRVTRGVRVFRTAADQKIVSVSIVQGEDQAEDEVVAPAVDTASPDTE